MIPDPFQMLGDEHQPERSGDVVLVLHHVCQKFAEDLLVQAINDSVGTDDVFGEGNVRVYERIQALLQYAPSRACHDRQVDEGFELRLLDQLERTAGDVHADSCHSGDIPDDLVCGRNKPEITGYGVFQSENFLTERVNLALQPIDMAAPENDVFRKRRLAIDKSLDRIRDHLL